MRLDEAIEVLESALDQFPIVGEGNFKEAIQLGLASLRREQRLRRLVRDDQINLLPGETPVKRC